MVEREERKNEQKLITCQLSQLKEASARPSLWKELNDKINQGRAAGLLDEDEIVVSALRKMEELENCPCLNELHQAKLKS